MEIEEKINVIYENVIKMFQHTMTFLDEAVSIYTNGKPSTPITINDDEIDKLERQIEEECLLIILKERPFATDLRKVTGIFKLVEDIERLGDHSEDIVWTITNLTKYNDKNVHAASLMEMSSVAISMCQNSLKAFINQDEKLANEILKSDDYLDQLYLDSLKEIPEKKEMYNLDDSFIIYSTLLSKYLERIGDHAINIAEWTIYIKNGYYKDKVII